MNNCFDGIRCGARNIKANQSRYADREDGSDQQRIYPGPERCSVSVIKDSPANAEVSEGGNERDKTQHSNCKGQAHQAVWKNSQAYDRRENRTVYQSSAHEPRPHSESRTEY